MARPLGDGRASACLPLWLGAILVAGAGAFEPVPCNATPVDCGVEFFREVYYEFERAESEVVIMPFFLRPELKIFSSIEGAPPDTTLADLIVRAVKRKVHVWIIGWDNAASEKFLPFHQDTAYERLFKDSGNSEYLHLMLDTGRKLVSSVYYLPHIKSYAFDRKVAFVGGLDFVENRRDTPQHIRPNPLLVAVKQDENHVTGNEKPWQDAMVKVHGHAAEHVAMVAIERWWTYCKSAGYARSQASRPLDALMDSFWKVHNSYHASQWKNYQCAHLPKPGLLGVLDLNLVAGVASRSEYPVEVFPPEVQSEGLARGERTEFNMAAGTRKQVQVHGLHSLDKQLPPTLDFTVQGMAFTARSDQQMSVDLADGSHLTARWLPNGLLTPDSNMLADQTCKVTLSGDRDWMGTKSPLTENLQEHIQIIRNAKRYIFIENQYFSTDFPSPSYECRHSNSRGQAVLYSGATNRLGEVLLDRIKRAGRLGEKFSVAVVIPLGTEPGSFYPNLRGTYCFEHAVESYWKEQELQSDWRDYFSFFFIANAVQAPPTMGGPGSAFYGIFTHTKAIVADDDVALVGSANINDRSMNGDRDAEVGVKVVGQPFPRNFRETILYGHLGNASLADPNDFVPSLRKVAEANARELYSKMGIKFPEGTVTRNGKTVRLFAMQSLVKTWQEPEEAALQWPESRVVAGGGGLDHFKWYVVQEATEPPRLQGLLFPWSREIWGLPKMTSVTQLISPEFNWRRLQHQDTGERDGVMPANESAILL